LNINNNLYQQFNLIRAFETLYIHFQKMHLGLFTFNSFMFKSLNLHVRFIDEIILQYFILIT